jgi:hypothetical protein
MCRTYWNHDRTQIQLQSPCFLFLHYIKALSTEYPVGNFLNTKLNLKILKSKASSVWLSELKLNMPYISKNPLDSTSPKCSIVPYLPSLVLGDHFSGE